MANGWDENDGTYLIWSSRSDDEEMRHQNHGEMFAQFEEEISNDKNVTRTCLISTRADKSPMTSKVRNIIESLNIPSSTYHAVLIGFDDTLSYLIDMLISMNREAKQSKPSLYHIRNKMEVKKTLVENLEL